MARTAGKHAIQIRTEASYADSKGWAELANKHITRFNLPSWDVPCTESDMDLWTGRLDISPEELIAYTNTDCEDWIAMNPGWPLRSFIGILLEYVDGRSTT